MTRCQEGDGYGDPCFVDGCCELVRDSWMHILQYPNSKGAFCPFLYFSFPEGGLFEDSSLILEGSMS